MAKVAEFGFPRTLVVAGDGFSLHEIVLLAHRVVWPDRSLLIDTAMSPAAGGSLPGAKFDAAAFQRVEKAMVQAQDIVFTHEHVDHVGGLSAAPGFGAVARQAIREQIQNGVHRDARHAPRVPERAAPLDHA